MNLVSRGGRNPPTAPVERTKVPRRSKVSLSALIGCEWQCYNLDERSWAIWLV